MILAPTAFSNREIMPAAPKWSALADMQTIFTTLINNKPMLGLIRNVIKF